jgi:hypothetical protein
MDQINASDIGYLPAGEDLDDYQFCPVGILASDGACYLADGTETIVLGILQNKPLTGEPCTIRHACGKMTKVLVGSGGCTIGARGKASDGTMIITTTSTDRILGIFMSENSEGEYASFLLEPGRNI